MTDTRKSHLERFRIATQKFEDFKRAWDESAKRSEWEDFKRGYLEVRSESKIKHSPIYYAREEIEAMCRGEKKVSTYGYEKGRLVGIAHDFVNAGVRFGILHDALIGAWLYEKLGYGNRESVKRKLVRAYEKNVEGVPKRRLSREDIIKAEEIIRRSS